MQIDFKDLIGYGLSFISSTAILMGAYFKLSGKQQELEAEILAIKSDMDKINNTHMNLTNSVVRLTESTENFKSEAKQHWKTSEDGLNKIFDKFSELDKNIAQFWKENGAILKKGGS